MVKRTKGDGSPKDQRPDCFGTTKDDEDCEKCIYNNDECEDCIIEMEKREPHKLMKYFNYGHLPDKLQYTSALFCALAQTLNTTLPGGTEKDVCLRKLLEAKDCAVRGVL